MSDMNCDNCKIEAEAADRYEEKWGECLEERERLEHQLSCCQEALSDAIAANTQAREALAEVATLTERHHSWSSISDIARAALEEQEEPKEKVECHCGKGVDCPLYPQGKQPEEQDSEECKCGFKSPTGYCPMHEPDSDISDQQSSVKEEIVKPDSEKHRCEDSDNLELTFWETSRGDRSDGYYVFRCKVCGRKGATDISQKTFTPNQQDV